MNLINGAEAQKLGAELYGIRAEHLDLSTSAGRWKGSLRHVEYLGLETIAYVDTDAGSLTLRKEGDLGLAPGAEVYLTPQEANGHRFRDGIRIS
jgi:ABC-type sugar transport system ATPase subunit